jgi:small-conductance mechanosensitive channel
MTRLGLGGLMADLLTSLAAARPEVAALLAAGSGLGLEGWLQEPAGDSVTTGVDVLSNLVRSVEPLRALRTGLWLFLGLPVVLFASRRMTRWLSDHTSGQQGLVVGKLILYSGVPLVLIVALWELGFSLAPLLGAAGVLGIAVGFASQTSISNVISGLFLLGERPFQVDDIIQVGATVGRVISIDTLSVKLCTFDNRFIRIPNETLVRSEVITITRFPIRRLDIGLRISYKESIGRVREVLLDTARQNPRVLVEPESVVFLDSFGESGMEVRLTVWTVTDNYFTLKNTLVEEIKVRFDAEGIRVPVPHRALEPAGPDGGFPVHLAKGGWPEGAEGSQGSEVVSETPAARPRGSNPP